LYYQEVDHLDMQIDSTGGCDFWKWEDQYLRYLENVGIMAHNVPNFDLTTNNFVLLKWILYALLVLSIVSVVMLICLFKK
jgi:hypothetical protein